MLGKKDLVKKIASQAGVNLKDAERMLNAFISIVEEELCSGGKVKIVGFGVFEISERKACLVKSPRDGQMMSVKRTRTAKFRPGKKIKNRLKGEETSDEK